MKPTTTCLPGIRQIGWVDCEKLQPNLRLRAVCGAEVYSATEVHTMSLAAGATCEAVTERVNGDYQQTTTLKFRSDCGIPSFFNLGFVVTDVQGNSFLIGAREPPFPHVKFHYTSGLPAGDPHSWEIEVTAVGIRSLIPIIY